MTYESCTVDDRFPEKCGMKYIETLLGHFILGNDKSKISTPLTPDFEIEWFPEDGSSPF